MPADIYKGLWVYVLDPETGLPSARSAASATGTVTSVNGAATDTSLLAANNSRRGATFFNESGATLYLLLSSTTASTTNYSVQISPFDYYELPLWYVGAVRGIWSSATGAVRITEFS